MNDVRPAPIEVIWPGFTERADVKGITLTFGMKSGVFKLAARSSDQEGLCPSGLQDNNYENPNVGINNTALNTLSDDFKSGGYTHLGTVSTHPVITFTNLSLYDLLFELTPTQRTAIGSGSSTFHLVISDKHSSQCLALNGVKSTSSVFKEGDPCPPDCYV